MPAQVFGEGWPLVGGRGFCFRQIVASLAGRALVVEIAVESFSGLAGNQLGGGNVSARRLVRGGRALSVVPFRCPGGHDRPTYCRCVEFRRVHGAENPEPRFRRGC